MKSDVRPKGTGKVDQPLHANVRQKLREEILNKFGHDERFSSVRELIKSLKVSQPTVVRALRDLVDEGYLRPDSRRGFFVQKILPARHLGLICPSQKGLLEGSVPSIALACFLKKIELHIHCFSQGETIESLFESLTHRAVEERMLLIGFTTKMTQLIASKLKENGYEHLIIGPRISGISGSSLDLDHEAEVDTIIDHLTSLGHERIVFMVNEPRDLIITSRRAETVKRKLKERNLSHSSLIFCDTKLGESSFEAAYKKTEEIWSKHSPKPTAIIPLSGVGAWAVLKYSMNHGIRIPEDLSVLAFDAISSAEWLPIAMTEMFFSHIDRANTALDMLWKESPEPSHGLFKSTLIVRATTGPARS